MLSSFTQLMNLRMLIKLKQKKAATKVETIATEDDNVDEFYTDDKDEPTDTDKVKTEERSVEEEETNGKLEAIDEGFHSVDEPTNPDKVKT